jgi:hypothetical protein
MDREVEKICRRCQSLLPASLKRHTRPLSPRHRHSDPKQTRSFWKEYETTEPSPSTRKQATASSALDPSKEQSSTQVSAQTFPLQGTGIDVDLQAGMFKRLQLVEIATELYKGLLTINLVLPPGTVFTEPKKWIWAALLAEIMVRLWGFLMSPELLRYAHRLQSAVHLKERNMTHGHSARLRQIIQWTLRTLVMELSHLLEWLASTMWVWMLCMAIIQPEICQMFKAKINWAPIVVLLHKFYEIIVGEKVWIWITRQRRQPSRRHRRNEGPSMELPRYGQGPWQ